MTNKHNNPIIQTLVDDLDENVVFTDILEYVDGNGTTCQDTVLDIINPVTGAHEQVVFNEWGSGLLDIFYYIDGNEEASDEIVVADLEELYEWILIEDTNDTV